MSASRAVGHPGPSAARLGGARLAALDGVRIVAALGVLCYHYMALDSAWGEPAATVFPGASACAAYGWLGVEIFFVVSGFVICMSAWGRGVGEFAASRISRLFPAYWAAVLFTAGVLFAWPEVRGVKAFSDVVVNLSMLQGGIKVPHIDDAYWTLFVELKFYALFALVVLRGVTYRNCVFFCTVWTVAGVVAPTADSGVLSFFAIPTFSPYFIAGIAFHLMRRFGPNAVLWGIAGLQFVLAQSYVQGRMISNLGRAAAAQTPVWPAHVVIACGFLVMAGIALGAFDRVRWRWLRHAGAVTYPLYLIHMMAGLTVIHHFRHDVRPVPLVLGVTTLMVALAWLIHRLIERPLGHRLRSGLRRAVHDIRRHAAHPAAVPAVPVQPSAPEAERIRTTRG
ncbi:MULTISPECIES: acyltransferase family protein [unclassified Streptomyces]|uniref:acyltransferase family protein n=1 Tax=unclassified Streptomyces TaxID=2593676 RepID=UPI002E148BDC|nr:MULTISPECIES: acyltransferase [unclassified Streptomyces]WSR24795.1 acyltransferase [Streptomyces sp. NBC_01205]